MIVLLLDSERDGREREGETCMPEDLDVAEGIEVEETGNRKHCRDIRRQEEDTEGQEEMTVTMKEEIKWRHRPFTTVIDTSFENPPIHEDHLMRPYEYFKRYIQDEIFNLMVENTNVYELQSGTLSFKPANPEEIRTLNDLHLTMGVMKMPRVSMYWEGGMDIGIFQNTMPRDRFFQLRSHLHLVNNLEKPAENNDVFFKVRPLYDALRSKSSELPLDENLCVDEQMVPFCGTVCQAIHHSFVKPHPWGVKIYFLCWKCGMAYDFLLHQDTTMELSQQHRKQLGLQLEWCTIFNHKLYFDNYFTTYNLLEPLAGRKIHAAGITRVSRFAKPLLQSDKEMDKKPQGSCDEVVSRDAKVALVKWYDNRPVLMASNFVGVGRMDEV